MLSRWAIAPQPGTVVIFYARSFVLLLLARVAVLNVVEDAERSFRCDLATLAGLPGAVVRAHGHGFLRRRRVDDLRSRNLHQDEVATTRSEFVYTSPY